MLCKIWLCNNLNDKIYVIIVGRNERRKNKDDSDSIENNWLFYWHECTKKALMTSVPKYQTVKTSTTKPNQIKPKSN